MDPTKVKRWLNFLLLFWVLDAAFTIPLVVLPRVYPGHALVTILAGFCALFHLLFGIINAVFLYRLLIQIHKPWLITILCYCLTLLFCFPLQWALIAVYSSKAKRAMSECQEQQPAAVPSA